MQPLGYFQFSFRCETFPVDIFLSIFSSSLSQGNTEAQHFGALLELYVRKYRWKFN
jgi:hypothetical protein